MVRQFKTYEVVNIFNALKEIIDNDQKDDNNEKIDSRLKYKLLLIYKCFAEPYATYEKVRVEIVMKYGKEELDDEGNGTGKWSISPIDKNAVDSFVEQMDKIQEELVDVIFTPLTADELFNLGLDASTSMKIMNIVNMEIENE